VKRVPVFSSPGVAWPLGSFCGLDPDEHGQLWCEAPRVCCESCGKTYGLGAWVPKKVPETCPRCGARVETEIEPVRANCRAEERQVA